MTASKVVSVRLSESLHKQVVEEAGKTRRTKSNLIAVLIEEALKSRRQQEKGG